MKLFHGLVLAALLAAGGSALAQSAPSKAEAPAPSPGRIVGGTEAKPDDAPWQVEIRIEPKPGQGPFAPGLLHYCGGALIAPDWVLTAAHCMPLNDTDKNGVKIFTNEAEALAHFKVYAGSTNLEHMQGYVIDRAIAHPDFGRPDGVDHNDIGLLHLARPVQPPSKALADGVTPTPIPLAKSPPTSGLPVWVTGWGALSQTAVAKKLGGSPVLQIVELKIIDSTQCMSDVARVLREQGKRSPSFRTVPESAICAGAREPGKDSCNGDSGGPLVALNYGRRVLVGLVSVGFTGCGAAPGGYTNVAKFVPWVTQTLAANGSKL